MEVLPYTLGMQRCRVLLRVLIVWASWNLFASYRGSGSAFATPRRANGAVPRASVAVETEAPALPTSKLWAETRFPGVSERLIPEKEITPSVYPGLLDVEKERKHFPIPEQDLIQLSIAFLEADNDPSRNEGFRVASNFKFKGPVVPALVESWGWDEYCEKRNSFDLSAAFPDLNPQYYDFRQDPLEPARIWFTARGIATNVGILPGQAKPSGKTVISPPQTCSLTFNEQGQAIKYTIGYVMDRDVGNTGGLGGIYGLLYGAGVALPFPEAQPWEPSLGYKLFLKFANLLNGKLV